MQVYRQKGRKTYMMDFTFKGHRVYKSTGETNKKRADKYATDYRDALKDGARGLWSKERPYLLGAAAEEWRNKPRKNPWSPSMQAIVAGALKRILPAFGEDRLLADIEAEDIARYQRDRLAEKKRPSNRTVNMEIGTLRKALIHAGHWPRLRDAVHMLPEREDVGQALTQEQERLLLEECGRSVSRSLLPFVTLALDTGARYDTIRTLQWDRADLQRGTIKIGKDKTAAGTGRTVPLNTRALRTLQFWAAQFPDRKPEHYVFPAARYGLRGKKGQVGKGGEVCAYDIDPSRPVGTIQSAWEAAKRRTQLHCSACAGGMLTERKPSRRRRGVAVEPTAAGYICGRCGAVLDALPEGLTHFRFHDLRHTAVSRMIAAARPLPIIAKVVGWRLSTVVEMAERYGHFQEDDMRRAVEAISAPSPIPGESTCAEPVSSVAVQ
jgi:integrase